MHRVDMPCCEMWHCFEWDDAIIIAGQFAQAADGAAAECCSVLEH